VNVELEESSIYYLWNQDVSESDTRKTVVKRGVRDHHHVVRQPVHLVAVVVEDEVEFPLLVLMVFEHCMVLILPQNLYIAQNLCLGIL